MPLYSDQSISTIHHVLRSTRRRLAVLLIAKNLMDQLFSEEQPSTSPELSVRELSREIVSIEKDIPLNHATGDNYHNVYTSLTQVHLERLDAIGAITYDADRKIIQPDYNLLALASVAVATSPLVFLLFRSSLAELNPGSPDSITD